MVRRSGRADGMDGALNEDFKGEVAYRAGVTYCTVKFDCCGRGRGLLYILSTVTKSLAEYTRPCNLVSIPGYL